MDIGQLVRDARERRGVGRASLAARAGVSVDRVAEAEGAPACDPALAARLLRALSALPSTGPDGPTGDLDDPALIARQRVMSMGERLESGFALCRFSSALAGTARR